MATPKQKKAFHKVTKENMPVSTAMLEAGYEPHTASKPSNLTKSAGWKELMDEFLPDSELARVHQEGLNASEKIMKDGVVVVEKPDYAVRHKYLDSAYKLKGVYAPEKNLNLNVTQLIGNKELEELANQINEQHRKDNARASEPSNGTETNTVGQEVQSENGEGATS